MKNMKNTKTIKAAIFDVDGTLLDSMPYWKNAGTIFLETLGISTKEDLGHILLSMTMEEGARYLINHYVPNMTEQQVLQGIIDVMNDSYKNKIPLKKGAKELLLKFKEQNIPVAIATATNRKLLEAALLRLGISDLIQKIFTCSECKTTKTVPDIYLACCNFFNTKPEETVVFEDTLVAITTVANANFICVGIKDKSSSHDAEKIMQKTNYYIEDFNQFFDLDFVNK